MTLINTIPGLSVDVERRKPALGFGTGGISGLGLLPVGVLAVWKVAKAVSVPLIGVGGISSVETARAVPEWRTARRQLAGASRERVNWNPPTPVEISSLPTTLPRS